LTYLSEFPIESPSVPRRVISRRVLAAAALAPGLLEGLTAFLRETLDSRPGVTWGGVAFETLEWFMLGSLMPVTYYMARRFPVQRLGWRRAAALHVAGALLLCATWTACGIPLGRAFGIPYAQGDLHRVAIMWMVSTFPWVMFLYLAMVGSVHAFWFFNEAREREAQASRLAEQLAHARLDALRMQLNPHFLFNTLNAVTVLVREQNTRAASRMLELVSDMLRHVLRTDQPHEVPLKEELRFVEQYLAVEQVRFSDRLQVAWSIDESARSALVPGFVLQPLVENAIRHGVSRRAEAGRIEISAHLENGDLRLSVSDDGAGVASTRTADGDGIGLANTRERLRTLYGQSASLSIGAKDGGGTLAVVTLPHRRIDG
jgi:two-component sensor histidine kinase